MRRAPIEERRRICRQCRGEFFAKPSAVRKFCSRACRGAAERKRPLATPRPCEVCQTVFTPYKKNGGARYCSKSCIWVATKGAAFNANMARSSAAKRGDALRGGGKGKSYRKLNGRHEHRVVAEQKIGRALQPGEIVHHVDGDLRNNSPDNLEVMTQGEHMRRHGLGIPGAPLTWKPWEHRK